MEERKDLLSFNTTDPKAYKDRTLPKSMVTSVKKEKVSYPSALRITKETHAKANALKIALKYSNIEEMVVDMLEVKIATLTDEQKEKLDYVLKNL